MIKRCHNIGELRDLARRRLPTAVFDVMDGAAESEATARRNTSAFDQVGLVPRCLVDVARVGTSATVLDQKLEWPMICSPTGISSLFDPQGELAVARAAERAGALYGLSMASSFSIEEVALASNGPKMFQLFICKDRDVTLAMIERAKRARYSALCITVNCPVGGKCERELRSGLFRPPIRWPIRTMVGIARHPWWSLKRLGRSKPGLANFRRANRRAENLQFLGNQFDASVTWEDLREILDLWGGASALKGVMSVEAACRAADLGFRAVIVSNHGGRQLDGSISSLEALPEIVSAVGQRVDVLLDGGVRRGVHVLKALALGAKACCIGRPYLYGLGAGGEAGVTRALDILRTEFVRAMQLAGCRNLDDIDSSLIHVRRGRQMRDEWAWAESVSRPHDLCASPVLEMGSDKSD